MCRKRRYAKKSANTQNLQPAPAFIDIAANLDLFKKAERAHPKATLRNRLYEDFGKKVVKGGTADSDLTGREAGNATDLGSQTEPEKENQLPSAPEAPSGEKGPKVVESGAEKSKMGIPRHLETMFSDAGLADPDRRAHLPLPVADPLTGTCYSPWHSPNGKKMSESVFHSQLYFKEGCMNRLDKMGHILNSICKEFLDMRRQLPVSSFTHTNSNLHLCTSRGRAC